MRNRTDARDAHSFALEFSGGFDLRPDHYSLQPLVDDSRNHNGLAAVQRRAYQSISRRTGHLDIVGEERADSRRGSLTRDDHLRLTPCLRNNPFCSAIQTALWRALTELRPNLILSCAAMFGTATKIANKTIDPAVRTSVFIGTSYPSILTFHFLLSSANACLR